MILHPKLIAYHIADTTAAVKHHRKKRVWHWWAFAAFLAVAFVSMRAQALTLFTTTNQAGGEITITDVPVGPSAKIRTCLGKHVAMARTAEGHVQFGCWFRAGTQILVYWPDADEWRSYLRSDFTFQYSDEIKS